MFFSSKSDTIAFLIRYVTFYVLSSPASLATIETFYGLVNIHAASQYATEGDIQDFFLIMRIKMAKVLLEYSSIVQDFSTFIIYSSI